MKAIYDGHCALCDEPIRRGIDDIARVRGEYAHARCAQARWGE